jgi:hypothetical protein
MAQKNRANMLTDIVSNIYNNLINFITGQNAQDRFVNLLDSSPNILSDASQPNGYVSTDANNEMFSSYYDEEISRADLITDLTANLAVGGKFYRINDAVGSTITLLVIAESNINLYSIGTDITTGEQGTYDITTDVFTPIVVSGTPDLQQVTDVGFSTTNKIISSNGAGSVGSLNNGTIDLTTGGATVNINASLVTTAYTAQLPDKLTSPQTFAMLEDIGAGGVPYTGATADVDLGIYSLTADTIGIGVAAGAEKLHIDGGATTTRVKIDADNGVSRILSFRTDDVQRWALRVDGIESGANSGGNFQLRRYDDAGAHIDNPIAINRANGNITTAQNINGATPTELGYLSGVTSAIQTQINGKMTNPMTTGGDIIYGGSSGAPTRLANGTAGQILQSNGTTLAPSWVAAPSGTNTQTLTLFALPIVTPTDLVNYFINSLPEIPTSIDARRAWKFTAAGTITAASFTLQQVTNGSGETVNIYLRNVTTATDTSIGTFTSNFGASTTLKQLFSGLSISVNATDDYTIKIAAPTWVTNPTNWTPSITLQQTV